MVGGGCWQVVCLSRTPTIKQRPPRCYRKPKTTATLRVPVGKALVFGSHWEHFGLGRWAKNPHRLFCVITPCDLAPEVLSLLEKRASDHEHTYLYRGFNGLP